MTRNVRDLRDLICVSRLSLRASDDEDELPDYLTRPYSVVPPVDEPLPPDSGFAEPSFSPPTTPTITPSPSPDDVKFTPQPPQGRKKNKSSKRRIKAKQAKRIDLPIGHELPKAAPLPPLGMNSIDPAAVMSMMPVRPETARMRSGDFDDVLIYMDATIVAGWLSRANQNLAALGSWVLQDDNFVRFAHFWISDFPLNQRQEIFRMEYSILLDELSLAFAAGRDEGKVRPRNMSSILAAVFREYPSKLLSSSGTYLFLDYLDVLSSDRRDVVCKQVLADVKVSTQNRQFAQLILATRSFTLVNVWSAIIGFYRRLTEGASSQASVSSSLPLPSSLKRRGLLEQRLYHAIRGGFIDVLHYLIRSGNVHGDWEDDHKRSLLFLATMHSQPKLIAFLQKKVRPAPDPNRVSASGNTALHAAVNKGSVECVTALLQCQHIDLNPRNEQCDGATPLHLAVMHDHAEIANVLLEAGADPSVEMGGVSALQLAIDFDKPDLVPMVRAHWPYSPESASLPVGASHTTLNESAQPRVLNGLDVSSDDGLPSSTCSSSTLECDSDAERIEAQNFLDDCLTGVEKLLDSLVVSPSLVEDSRTGSTGEPLVLSSSDETRYPPYTSAH